MQYLCKCLSHAFNAQIHCLNEQIIISLKNILSKLCVLGLKKNRCVSANMPKKIRVGRSENLFIFLQIFI